MKIQLLVLILATGFLNSKLTEKAQAIKTKIENSRQIAVFASVPEKEEKPSTEEIPAEEPSTTSSTEETSPEVTTTTENKFMELTLHVFLSNPEVNYPIVEVERKWVWRTFSYSKYVFLITYPKASIVSLQVEVTPQEFEKFFAPANDSEPPATLDEFKILIKELTAKRDNNIEIQDRVLSADMILTSDMLEDKCFATNLIFDNDFNTDANLGLRYCDLERDITTVHKRQVFMESVRALDKYSIHFFPGMTDEYASELYNKLFKAYTFENPGYRPDTMFATTEEVTKAVEGGPRIGPKDGSLPTTDKPSTEETTKGDGTTVETKDGGNTEKPKEEKAWYKSGIFIAFMVILGIILLLGVVSLVIMTVRKEDGKVDFTRT